MSLIGCNSKIEVTTAYFSGECVSEEFLKSVNNCRRNGQKFAWVFLTHTVETIMMIMMIITIIIAIIIIIIAIIIIIIIIIN